MTACNFRSLLLAAIVLSNCISWTASRHHYTHNVHQHRTRHRRQGAGLYLSASYVIPGGEGGGAWGEWGEVSPCSRTCGGGVASQKRICLQIGPDGRPQCTGGDTKYFSCQTQDCPAGAIDFRAEQCAEFNDKDFRGFRYNWVPYTKAPNPCELNCMPHGERFYFRHKLKVTDGTRCNDESFDVCVDGSCQPVGCDMMLGSNAREDKCRECRGNGTNCHTSSGIFDSQDLVKGYNDILLIPQGSTTIVIEEIMPSNNYLALRAKNGTYYLNGHYHIDFPRSIMIAGALWSYERSQQGYAAPDRLRCQGPTSEPLYLSLLLQDTNVGIRYEYSIPNNTAPPTDKRYNWVHEDFTPCSATCGGGFQTRNVTCRSREELEIVDDNLCDEGLKPPTNQTCNPDPCPAQWVEGPWGNCSKRCGSEGVSSREVTCQQVIANGISSIVPDKKCFDLLGPKPELFQECNRDAPCPTWFVGNWKPCDKLCDEGKRTRQVVCYQKNKGRVELLDDEDCTDEKPELEKPCMLKPCDGVDWVTTEWSGCDTCLSKVRTRIVVCSTKYQKVLNDSFCLYHTRPADREECDEKKLPKCEVQWYASQWSKCSVDCGEGVQTRKVFCGLYDGHNVEEVKDTKCADLPKYNDTKPCSVPKEKCPAQWFAGPWSACTKECGGGERDRRVMCLRGDENVRDCDGSLVLDSSETCNMQPCDKDETLPLDSKSTPIMDEEECDYDTDYPEVGLDADSLTSTTLDMMLSDSPSYAEFESTLKETGSGMGTTLAEEELTSFEGSGIFSTDFDSSTTDGTTDTEIESPTGTPPTGETRLTASSLSTVVGSATTPASGKNATGGTTSNGTDKTGSTESDAETGSTTDSSGSSISEETDSTESTSTEETVTDDTDSTSTDKTGSTESGATSETGSTPSDGTDSTESSTMDKTDSTLTDNTGLTSSVKPGSTKSATDETGSTPSDGTSSTESSATDKTGSTPKVSSGLTSSAKPGSSKSDTDETGSTPTDGTGSTSSDGTGSTESSATDETGSTESSATDETGSTESSATDKTGSTESSATDETGSTESSAADETGSTVVSVEPGSTESSATDKTGSTPTVSSGFTSSVKPGSTKSATDETGSTPSDGTGSTESSATDKTGSTPTVSSGLTSSAKPGSSKSDTDETGSTPTDGTGSTSSDETGSTESSATDKTGSTESSATDETGSTESSATEEIGSTKSNATDETGSIPTDSTGSTESSATDKTGSTAKETISMGSTESTVSTTTEKGSTDASALTGVSSSTKSKETGSTGTEETETKVSGETISTASTGSTESTVTSETNFTGADVTTESSAGITGSTIAKTTESAASKTSERSSLSSAKSTVETSTSSKSGATEITAESGSSVSSESTDESTTVAAGSTGTTLSSEAKKTTLSGTTGISQSTTTEPSGSSITTELSTDISETTIETSTTSGSESTTEPGATISTGAYSGSSTLASSTSSSGSTIESSTSSGSIETTEPSSSASTESSTEISGTSTVSGSEYPTETGQSSTTISAGSTEEGSSTVSGVTELNTAAATETKVEGSSSSEGITETGSTEGSSSSEGITETGSTEGSSSSEGITETGSTEASQSTTEGLSSTEGSTIEGITLSTGKSIWDLSTTLGPRRPGACKPRRKTKCDKTEFGCCPDKKTAAAGPFDEGCLKPRTCKESLYGCCPDGLSPALGDNNEGCPIEPCADTLFGCCLSDNKTAAQGNDQDGCPPPPPPCASSEFGCCADNETEAIGPEKEGCPESETTSTSAVTETTAGSTEFSKTSGASEASESSEASTSSEGSTTVTSSTTLDLCANYAFGCCGDNETEASGPDGQGCPCNATEFGCCSDGVSPAQGVEMEGCPGHCSTSPHGCCADNKTPAHGPDFEGCCLLQAFGCCPDNSKPAEGPHLEGCGCQYTAHGCCPDNVTIAQGPDNKGCGCAYTEHGCCPDRHTEASGPDNEGCSCNTFQFGCCQDGVTVAKGPDQQGCKCVDSTYGCCGDGETSASGPNAAGCDCSSSKYGCCPDGQTEAMGPKFAGCTDVPENKQAVCSLPTDVGPCHNFTAVWYYDLAYGGCSRFWYGGCEGNGNRFATKEDCEDVCVQPAPRDACKLPSVKGPCDGEFFHWHYNSSREQCIPFRYGGCLGNANNFDTRDLCQAQCDPARITEKCTLPIEQGPCAGLFSRWGFNSETHTCEQFTWGGCEGNGNRFKTKAACQLHCDPPGSKPECTQQQEAGTCDGKEALWSFSMSENRCVPFYYSGCGGNGNRFESRETCEQTCPSAYVADKCTLPAETGKCSNYRERWFYDTSNKRCRQFYYGGCAGNENNFVTEAECESSCSETPPSATTTTTTRPAPTKPQPRQQQPETKQQPKRPESEPERPDFCLLEIDPGPCTNMQTKYAYDSDLGRCRTFEYGGCGGNRNNFPDETYCMDYCHPVQDICQLPMLSGPCEESLMRWFYDSSTDSCSQFTYGGCEGNDNRFDSLEACESRCKTGPAQTTLRTTKAPKIEEAIPAECRISETLEECYDGGEVWYFDQNVHECVAHSNQESGSACRHAGTFNSQEACERSCGAFMGVEVCQQRLDPGPCDGYVIKVYYDAATGECREFEYGGCLGGANRFSTIEECSQICKPEIDPCSLPPEQGNCYSYTQQWYYDSSRGKCYEFMYTGCSGNENRFGSQGECEARCKHLAPVTTTTPASLIPAPEPVAECTTPTSLAPCGENVTVFYYDSEKRQCLASGFGNCGHPNTYNTEEECERRCGAFVGINVCGERLDPGPCRASIPKFYWDSITASCQPFAYGGCLGGPNRFSTVAECQYVCGDSGPDSNEVLPPDCEIFREECEVLNCQYGIDNFTENGCERCKCVEDPCVRADCSPSERCVASAVRDPATGEPRYSARCVTETTKAPESECARYAAECASLECARGLQRTRTRTPGGCERCACAPLHTDCTPLEDECRRLSCSYGMDTAIGSDGCWRCKCKVDPCKVQSCAAGERCVVVPFRNSFDPETKYTSECRNIEKPGVCPPEEPSNEETCRQDCQDDSECRGVGKCCRRGCSHICTLPAEPTAPHPLLTTTYAPDVPAPPKALAPQEPQVSAAEGGTATLRCLFHGNPPPKITWRRGELTIDGSVGRYRLTSDGALEIVSLYRNDTGVYICVADNGLGVARQEIHLVVNDPVRSPVGIAGDENAVVTGELGKPLTVRCLAYGYPLPAVFWYRGLDGNMVPFNDAVYEARGNILLIRSLAIETLGEYTCQAYNGEGKAASWVVSVQAYKPEGIFLENEYLVPRYPSSSLFKTRPPTTKETTTTTTTITEAHIPVFTVPVNTHVSTPYTTLNVGTELQLTCEVDGFPEPDVYWTKDGARIQTDSRITISGSTIVSRLSVSRVSVSDSGLYTCHASNLFSSHSDTAQINVQQQTVPAKCTDNPFFANCDLIVRSNFCRHKYYSKFCCKSCVEAGQLDPMEAELQADQPYRRK